MQMPFAYRYIVQFQIFLSAFQEKGSSLPLTLINSVGNFSYLLFNFSVVFFKLRNSSVIKVFVSYCLSWVKGRLDPFSGIPMKRNLKMR